MATAVSVTKTNNAEIDGLLGGTKWTGTITYSFPDSPSDYAASYSTSKEPSTAFSQVPAAEQVAINYAVGLILSYTNASIQYAGTNGADIEVARSSAANPTSYAYYPSNSTTGTGGDVWFGTTNDYTQAKLGNYYFTTALHELGHAFGLKHSQELGGVANVAVPAAHDDSEFTVMSYRSYVGGPLTGYTNEAYGYPQTYMANDILALQTLYGANFATHAENTVYSWNPATGQEFINGLGQPAPGGGAGGSANRVFMTVWDGNGVDTYDLSNYSGGVSVNLNPGASSITSTTQLAYLGNGHYAQGNIFNAYLYNGDARSYIENAIGGAGNDTIVGNAASNNLNGGAGNDTLSGGPGYNTIDGGSGTDTAVFSGGSASYSVSYNPATQVFTVIDQRAGSPDGTDIVINVENFQFADGIFASSTFMVANHAPVLTVPASVITANPGQVLQVSSWFSAVDVDNDALTYCFADGTTAANSGQFVLNGTPLGQGAIFGVSAAQLAGLTFVASAAGVPDGISMQLTDGHAVSENLVLSVHVNHAPVLTVPASVITVNPGQVLQVSSWFNAVDADNDALTYCFADGTTAANSGQFVLNGTPLGQGAIFGVSAAQLGGLTFVASAAGVPDGISMQLTDGHAVSENLALSVHVNHAPVLSVPASVITANAGEVLQVSSWFSAFDTDSDALTYCFADGTTAANSGQFVLNGTPLGQGAIFGVSAAQLAGLTFVASAVGVPDGISMQLTDGHAVSEDLVLSVHVNHAPVLTVPASVIEADPGQALQVSSWFSATDVDNDALTYCFADGTTAANSGQFVLNGTPLGQGAIFGVSAAQLAGLTFVASAAGVPDGISMQLTDGHAVSENLALSVHVNGPAPAAGAGSNGGAVADNWTVAGVTPLPTSPPADFRADSGFAFVAGLGSNVTMEVISHIEAAVPYLHGDIAAPGPVGALETPNPAPHVDFSSQPHELQPAGHLLDYFIV